jgi:Holliday junction resolvase RusA-like endonuclease
MNSELLIVVPGVPMGKGAARHTRSGFTYTPEKTRNYMAMLTDYAVQAGARPLDCPCSIRIRAFFPIPDSHSKKLKDSIRAGQVYYTKKPDTDNLSKIKDALNGIAFRDDCLVWREEIIKYYSDNPRLEIKIYYESEPIHGVLGFRS